MNEVNSSLNILNMPEEVIIHIVQFLPYADKIVMRLVCKYFYACCTKRATISEEVVVVDEDYLEKGIIPILMNSTRNFTSFELRQLYFSQQLFDVFDKYGASILNLSLIDCDICEEEFKLMLRKCTKLQTFHLSSAKSLFMNGFRNDSPILEDKLNHLKGLSLEDCSYLTDDIFKKIINISPNITVLSLQDNAITFHSALCKRFYRNDLSITNPSNCVFTIFYISKVLEKIASNIKCLNFSNTNIDNASLMNICKLEELKLEKLYLGGCQQLCKRVPLFLGYWQPSIIELDLKGCPVVTSTLLQEICTHMTQLRILNISHCCGVTNEGLVYLNSLRHLRELNISYCNLLSTVGLQSGLNKDVLLTDFSANQLSIEEYNLLEIIDSFSNLIYLDLRCCETLSNVSLKIFFRNCKKIKYLHLGYCANITDDGFIPCNFFDMTDDKPLDKNVCYDCSIDNLKGLHSLDLAHCDNFTGRCIQFSFNLPDVRNLNLRRTKITSHIISSLIRKCPRLVELDISFCDINDNAAIDIIKNLQHLRSLKVSNCVALTDRTLSAVLQYSHCLQTLIVTGCNKMTKTFLSQMPLLPTLKNFDYTSVPSRTVIVAPPAPPIVFDFFVS